ncbi:MAG TPA: TIGR02757 family protein [Sandaracinaceae bacterium LLY-WYZ-13_1]|nr:TIGR02757 family protein [Sandaracinaceae bacterium LLY-WYZ-13_1]
MKSASLKARLDELLATHDAAAHRAADPVSFVHRYDAPDDQEVVGLVAASLAFGNVVAIRRSVGRALDALGPRPAQTVDRARRATLERRLDGFVHRVWRGPHLAAVLAHAGRVRRREGSLGAALATRIEARGSFREGLADLADALRGPGADRGRRHLMADPRAGSACKRLLLWVRWMSRPADGVDLGLWAGVSPSALVIPVDTHVHRIAKNLRLTERNDASWRTAEEITAALRRFDPDDPVKYDFALCHLGVSRRCPSRRDPDKCDRCVLRRVCRHWRQGR